MSDEGYINLRTAILQQATKDYIKALQDGNHREAKKLECFFKGEWGEFLSGGHGDFLVSECKKRANLEG